MCELAPGPCCGAETAKTFLATRAVYDAVYPTGPAPLPIPEEEVTHPA